MIASAWRSLEHRYRLLTPRERAFVATLGAVLAVFGAQSSFDWVMRTVAEEERAGARAAELRMLAATLSDDRVNDELGIEAGKIWRASIVDTSFEGAQAQAVLAVENLALQAGLDGVEVALSSENDAGESAVRGVDVQMASQGDWLGVIALLEALETAEPAFMLRGMSFRSEDGVNELRVVLRAPVLLEAPE